MRIIKCDILVVGGGGAALRAAIAAKEYNKDLKVMIATKGKLGKSGVTATACSDRMAFHATLEHTEPGGPDSWRYHADDIYRIGGMVSDYNLAEVLAQKAKDAFEYLDGLGVPFVKKNGLPDQFVTDGSEYARACYTGPYTAVHIEEALMRRFEEMNIGVLDFCMVAKLVKKHERVIGAIALDTREMDFEKAVIPISAGAVILAAGGGGMIYEHNVFPAGMTGDGYALAYEAGAELVNMEFIQMGIASTKTKFNCSGSMMRAVPRLINDSGEEFLKKYFPEGTSCEEICNTLFKKGASWPVSYEHKTHIIDIALYKEMKAGRRIFLDYSKNPEGFRFDMLSEENRLRYRREQNRDLGAQKRNESPLCRLMEINEPSVRWFSDRGIDLTKGELIEVAACAQHFQGGVKIDEHARTTVHGLWAVGETAGGQHGANRPGGNALLDCQVFGRIAGEDAAREVLQKGNNMNDIAGLIEDDAIKLVQMLNSADDGEVSAEKMRKQMQRIVESGAGVVRTGEGLQKALQELQKLKIKRHFVDEHGPAYFMENKNMLMVAQMVMEAALMRDESRGPHLRFARYEDNTPMERRDPEWGKYIVIYKNGGDMILEKRKPQTPK
ncbi:MAG: FAD-binding protein [Tepidanaerobacteraceae bacterium]|jgi:succinate dehydrogenase / fumarate reductase flavoprotein subunit|nr:FAD-binding protein [Tepidanaerobacteraceae bacterium]